MEAQQHSLIRLMQERDTLFIIPVYQRNYDWTEKHCHKLYYDILEVGKNMKRQSHFIGSIVYIHEGIYSSARRRELTIIDGQQRLMTLTLLWAAIFNFLKERGDEKGAEKIKEKYLEDEGEVKLRPTQNNAEVLEFIFKSKADKEDYREKSRLIDNYKFFRSRVTEHSLEQIQDGIAKLIYVDIALNREKDEPQRIFESLNSTGLDLSQGDLIRNYVLMELEPKIQKNFYKEFWFPIEEMTTNRETHQVEVSDFIRHYLTFRNREIPKKSRVYETFKEKFPDKDEESLQHTLEDIRQYAAYYQKLINPEDEKDRFIQQQIKYINKLEINVSYPFLLEVYHDFAIGRIDRTTFIEVLELLQSFVWRRFISGLPTNALNKIFSTLYRDVDFENYLESLQIALLKKSGTQRFPSDEDVLRELEVKDMYNIQAKNRSYCFDRLENHNNKERVIIEGNKDITVEHIFPRKPNSKWGRILGKEEMAKMSEKQNSLANLTLSGNNGNLSNKYFTDKRDLPEKGYRDSRLFLNRYLRNKEQWTSKELKARFRVLAKRFFDIWKYPEVELTEMVDNSAINIFDIDDPTNSKIDHVFWEGERMYVHSHRELLEMLTTTIFESNPSVFFTTDLGDKLKLSRQDGDIGGAVPISEDYFIEGGLSAKEIFSRVKYMLEKAGKKESLFVKLVF